MSSHSDEHDSGKILLNRELDALGLDFTQRVVVEEGTDLSGQQTTTGEDTLNPRRLPQHIPQHTSHASDRSLSAAASNDSTNEQGLPDESFGSVSRFPPGNGNAQLLRAFQSEQPPLPSFLGDGQIREAMRRAKSLHYQRHGVSAVPPSQLEQLGWGGNGIDGTVRNPFPDFSPAFIPKQQPTSGSIPQKFEPGHESSSVLQITKRPRLRNKDIEHRKSLTSTEVFPQSSSTGTPPANVNVHPRGVSGLQDATSPLRFFGSYPPVSVDVQGTFLINLQFGARLVGVPVEKTSFGDHETARTSFGDRSPKLTLYALLPGIVGSVVSSFTRNSG
jgi:hypothetical protein